MKVTDFFIPDPGKGDKPSVSLTLLVVSFCLLVVVGGLQVFGVIQTVGVFSELMYSSMALYFGRQINVNNKMFTSGKAEEIEEKVKA